MERVLGIGGVFFRARDPKKLAAWYRENLGVPIEADQTFGTFRSTSADEPAVWATFPQETEYFGSGNQSLMINYRVRDIDRILSQLRAIGTPVDERIEESEFGRFGWATD